jgi:anti-sigma factor (TIGR02949 family)
MSVPISCDDAVRELWEYLDHGLDDTEIARLERHLSFCVQCCGELEFARALQGMLRATTPSMPGEVRERLGRFIDSLDAALEGDPDGR